MKFTVIDTKTGKYPDMWDISINEEWAQYLMYCDMEGFAIREDGTMILLDERLGQFVDCPEGRFKVALDELNDPLTLEELLEMDGMPVYLISARISEWNVLDGKTLITTAYDVPRTGLKTVTDGIKFINGRKFRQDHYLKTWWAYRRPPARK